MSAGALPSPPSRLLSPVLQHYSQQGPETGQERMETKIGHQRGKECQEEQNWGKKKKEVLLGKKKNEVLACLKSMWEERKGRSCVGEQGIL